MQQMPVKVPVELTKSNILMLAHMGNKLCNNLAEFDVKKKCMSGAWMENHFCVIVEYWMNNTIKLKAEMTACEILQTVKQ